MLVLKYFVMVGAVLFAGLLALNAHLATPGQVSIHKPMTSSLPMATPAPAPPPEKAGLAVEPAPNKAKKSASPSRRSKQSRSGQRASR